MTITYRPDSDEDSVMDPPVPAHQLRPPLDAVREYLSHSLAGSREHESDHAPVILPLGAIPDLHSTRNLGCDETPPSSGNSSSALMQEVSERHIPFPSPPPSPNVSSAASRKSTEQDDEPSEEDMRRLEVSESDGDVSVEVLVNREEETGGTTSMAWCDSAPRKSALMAILVLCIVIITLAGVLGYFLGKDEVDRENES